MDFTIVVNDENTGERDSNSTIRYSISISIAKTSYEGCYFFREQVSNVLQGCYLEQLRFLINDFSLEGFHHSIGTHDNWTIGHVEVLILFNAFDVVSCGISLAYGSRRQIEDRVAILLDRCVEFSYAIMGPVPSKPWQNVAKHVSSSDGAIDIRDDYLGSIVPHKDPTLDLLLAKQGALYSEDNLVRSIVKVKLLKLLMRRSQSLLVVDFHLV